MGYMEDRKTGDSKEGDNMVEDSKEVDSKEVDSKEVDSKEVDNNFYNSISFPLVFICLEILLEKIMYHF
jgi:hypothetical protein